MREKLIQLRKSNNFTQEDMATKLEIARTTYTGYENGTFSPSLDMAIRIKKILNYQKDDIFSNTSVSETNEREKEYLKN